MAWLYDEKSWLAIARSRTGPTAAVWLWRITLVRASCLQGASQLTAGNPSHSSPWSRSALSSSLSIQSLLLRPVLPLCQTQQPRVTGGNQLSRYCHRSRIAGHFFEFDKVDSCIVHKYRCMSDLKITEMTFLKRPIRIILVARWANIWTTKSNLPVEEANRVLSCYIYDYLTPDEILTRWNEVTSPESHLHCAWQSADGRLTSYRPPYLQNLFLKSG